MTGCSAFRERACIPDDCCFASQLWQVRPVVDGFCVVDHHIHEAVEMFLSEERKTHIQFMIDSDSGRSDQGACLGSSSVDLYHVIRVAVTLAGSFAYLVDVRFTGSMEQQHTKDI